MITSTYKFKRPSGTSDIEMRIVIACLPFEFDAAELLWLSNPLFHTASNCGLYLKSDFSNAVSMFTSSYRSALFLILAATETGVEGRQAYITHA